ncbi:MAG: acyl-CoA desaturase [Labilithrix sp.]|nr:acyl-CoA desaturase [Labilithrix sp.]MCW5815225.1 acyl-CoA desaturase [Labilithrix sp.]
MNAISIDDAAAQTDDATARAVPASARTGQATKNLSPSTLRAERTFATLVVVVPFLGLIGAIAWRVLGLTDVAVFVLMYLLTGFGITVGFHRLFTHQSFECARWVRVAFAVAGSMALQGPVIRWVADHRRHHAFSDRPGDPHSPHVGGRGALGKMWHAHVGWFFDTEKTRIRRFVPDLVGDAQVAAVDRLYWLWAALTLALPFVLGAVLSGTWRGGLSGLLWGGFARAFFVHHVTWSINSICHVFGRRPFKTRDRSSNVAWLAIPSLGESWHNAHHAFPTSAVHGVRAGELDPSAWLIALLERTGLAWDVKRPTAAQLASRRVTG